MKNFNIFKYSSKVLSLGLVLFLFVGCSAQKKQVRPDRVQVQDKEFAQIAFKEGVEALYHDNEQALQKFNQAKEIDNEFLPAFYNAGIANELLGSLNEAVLNYESCMALNPKEPSCLNNLVTIKFKLNEIEYCENLVTKYLNDFPNEPFANVLAATLFYLKSDLVSAEKYARFAIEFDAENVDALYLMLRIFYDQKSYPAARFVAKNALAVAPSHGGLNLYQGHAFLAEGLQHDALESYARAVKFQPSKEALESYGQLLMKMGKVKEGIAQLERLVAADEKNATSQLLLGNAYAAAKKFENAKSSYETVLAINPQHPLVKFNLGLLYFELKPQGLPELERALKAQSYFNEFLSLPGLFKEKIDETNKYLKSLSEKIEIEKSYTETPEEEAQPIESEPVTVPDEILDEEDKPEIKMEPEENEEETPVIVPPKEDKALEPEPKKKKLKKDKKKKKAKPAKDEYDFDEEDFDEELDDEVE